MTSTTGKVFVTVQCATYEHKMDDVFATRMPQLGLTGYGRSKEEAERNCKRLFGTFINAHRRQGDLDAVLNRAKVEWTAESPTDVSHYEDATQLDFAPVSASEVINRTLAEWAPMAEAATGSDSLRVAA